MAFPFLPLMPMILRTGRRSLKTVSPLISQIIKTILSATTRVSAAEKPCSIRCLAFSTLTVSACLLPDRPKKRPVSVQTLQRQLSKSSADPKALISLKHCQKKIFSTSNTGRLNRLNSPNKQKSHLPVRSLSSLVGLAALVL